jgi:hypothetical protein
MLARDPAVEVVQAHRLDAALLRAMADAAAGWRRDVGRSPRARARRAVRWSMRSS